MTKNRQKLGTTFQINSAVVFFGGGGGGKHNDDHFGEGRVIREILLEDTAGLYIKKLASKLAIFMNFLITPCQKSINKQIRFLKTSDS